MRLFWGILGLLLLTLPARADTIYDISGTATITGNDVCNGVCVETINFNFQLDDVPYRLLAGYYMLDIVPGGTLTASGPLGAPGLVGIGCDRECYVAIFLGQPLPGFLHTEFDLGLTNTVGASGNITPTPYVPEIDSVDYLYSCGDSACLADFCIEPGPFGCSPPVIDWGPVTSTVTEVTSGCVATPEPQTWAMLWIGLIGLALLKFAPRGKRPFAKLKASLRLVLSPAIFPIAQPGRL